MGGLVNIPGTNYQEIMKKFFGVLLTLAGFIACIFTGMQVVKDSDSFTFFGMDVVVSKADYTPFILSVGILISGAILLLASRK